MHELLPNARTERASIDESFLDLSRDIYDRLLQQYSDVLRHPPSGNGDYSQHLPLPPPRTQPLDWSGSHLVANPDEETEEMDAADLDWDDIAMAIGADIVRHVRTEVFNRLGYTCSAGVANNKTMAKLGSGFKKPNQQVIDYQCYCGSRETNLYSSVRVQTVVRASAVHPFLSTFKFTKSNIPPPLH